MANTSPDVTAPGAPPSNVSPANAANTSTANASPANVLPVNAPPVNVPPVVAPMPPTTQTNNAALANAIQALTTVIASMQAQSSTPAIYDPFAHDQPFNVAARAGAQAYTDASAPLDTVWDGDISTFPSFVVALRIRASDAQWNAASPHDILDVLGHDILTDYHTIAVAEIESARLARTNNRAIQKDNVSLYQGLNQRQCTLYHIFSSE